MACDDGDIIAYYTHQLNAEIIRNLAVQRGSISETVHSRLIAVSSNRHEITVFAFAIGGNIMESDETIVNDVFPNQDISAANQRHPMSSYSPRAEEGNSSDGNESLEHSDPTNYYIPPSHDTSATNEAFPLRHVHPGSAREKRQCGYKLVFNPLGRNIPSIDFSSDQNFDADSIFATDVCGNLWSLDLWMASGGWRLSGARPFRVQYSSDHHPTPLGDFKIETTPQVALGCDQPAIVQHTCGFFDIDCTTSDVRDTADTLSPALESDEANTTAIHNMERVSEKFSRQNLTTEDLHRSLNLPQPVIEDKTCWQDFLRQLNSSKTTKHQSTGNFPPDLDKASSPQGVAIFQTLRTSVQLLPRSVGLPSTICHDVLNGVASIERIWNNPNGLGLGLVNYHRLNMIAKIPELSLLVVASQIGVVALFTLTRLKNGFSQHGPVVMLRLDLVLPFSQHVRFLKKGDPLLGMAVSPQPSSEPWDARKSTRPRRWRLMLTYFSGAVMSYELSRGENDELWII